MLPLFTILLATAFAALWLRERERYHLERAERAYLAERLRDSEEYRELVKQSGLRGHPLVKWHHRPTEVTYLRARFEGQEHLFTQAAVSEAKQKAELLLDSTL